MGNTLSYGDEDLAVPVQSRWMQQLCKGLGAEACVLLHWLWEHICVWLTMERERMVKGVIRWVLERKGKKSPVKHCISQ